MSSGDIFRSALQLHQTGRLADAKSAYVRLLNESPDHADAPHLVGVSRSGLTVLLELGLNELVAETTEEYIQIAIDLAVDRARVSELRTTPRQRMIDSPSMDEKAYVAGLEAACRMMWKTWCESGK